MLLSDSALDEVLDSDRRADLFLDWVGASDERLSGINPPDTPRLSLADGRRWHLQSSTALIDALTPSPRLTVSETNDLVATVLDDQASSGDAPTARLLLTQRLARLAAGVLLDQAGLVLAGRDATARERIRDDHEIWLRDEIAAAERLGISVTAATHIYGAHLGVTHEGEVRRAIESQPQTPTAYRHVNSKGVAYYLNAKDVTLRGGKAQTIYFFSRDVRLDQGVNLPDDRTVNENPRNGFLTLRRKERVGSPPTRLVTAATAIKDAQPFPLPATEAFALPSTSWSLLDRARHSGLHGLSAAERSLVAREAGAVAHSEVAVIFDQLGFTIIWQGERSGPDLLLLSPTEDAFVAVEARGAVGGGVTVRNTRLPSWRHEFIAEAGINVEDAYGALVLVDFASNEWRAALTHDLERFVPVRSLEQLVRLDLGD